MRGRGLRGGTAQQDSLVGVTHVQEAAGLLLEQVEIKAFRPEQRDTAFEPTSLLGERGHFGAGLLHGRRSIDPGEEAAFALHAVIDRIGEAEHADQRHEDRPKPGESHNHGGKGQRRAGRCQEPIPEDRDVAPVRAPRGEKTRADPGDPRA